MAKSRSFFIEWAPPRKGSRRQRVEYRPTPFWHVCGRLGLLLPGWGGHKHLERRSRLEADPCRGQAALHDHAGGGRPDHHLSREQPRRGREDRALLREEPAEGPLEAGAGGRARRPSVGRERAAGEAGSVSTCVDFSTVVTMRRLSTQESNPGIFFFSSVAIVS